MIRRGSLPGARPPSQTFAPHDQKIVYVCHFGCVTILDLDSTVGAQKLNTAVGKITHPEIASHPDVAAVTHTPVKTKIYPRGVSRKH